MAHESPESVAVRYNDQILSTKGDEFAQLNKVEYNKLAKRYMLTVEGVTTKVNRAEVDAFMMTLTPPSGSTLADLLKSDDLMLLMKEGVEHKNWANLLIGKAYYLHLKSDNPSYEAFASHFLEVFGSALPSKSSLTKAGKVYERFWEFFQNEDGTRKENAPTLEELSKASLGKLYSISAQVDEGHDARQMVEDAKTLNEGELHEKYVADSTKSNAGSFKNLPKVRVDVYDRFRSTLKDWGELVGGQQVSENQGIDALIELFDQMVHKTPDVAIQLWQEFFEARGDEAPDVPRTRSGKLKVKELATYPNDTVSRMFIEGKITTDDLYQLDDDEIRAIGLGREAGLPDETDDE